MTDTVTKLKTEENKENLCPTCGQSMPVTSQPENTDTISATQAIEQPAQPDKSTTGKLLVNWRPEFDVGVLSIDEQHHKIVDMINIMHISIKTATRRPHFIADLISELDHYVKEHFSDEEGMMKKFGYPEFSAHQKEHHDFILKIKTAHDEYKSGIFDLKGLLSFIVHWFMEHIQGTDRTFAEWVKKKNQGT